MATGVGRILYCGHRCGEDIVLWPHMLGRILYCGHSCREDIGLWPQVWGGYCTVKEQRGRCGETKTLFIYKLIY